MYYGIIVAGGSGSRMGGEIPKQYLMLGDKPILVHTTEKFCMVNEIDKNFILVPSDRVDMTEKLLDDYLDPFFREKVKVLSGGDSRNETIMNAIRYLEKEGFLDSDTVIITHDAVRPFVTENIILENIKALEHCDALTTAISATDTIL
jgi:2-C-methyl-D-erythritol 4-phosphate cytidylyltransferase